MAFNGSFLLSCFLAIVVSCVASNSIIRLPGDALFCDSWRLAVETDNVGKWDRLPARCLQFVKDYLKGGKYRSDSDVITGYSLKFAKSVKAVGDGKDAWVLDIDETLLSNLPYYEVHGFGSEMFDEQLFDEWVALAEAPALPASLVLYKGLQKLGFKLVLLTGRSEYQRNATERNLLRAGYRNWETLFLRGSKDQGKPATIYKSEKRQELIDQGYRIHGNSGDQWSDLLGYAVATRSFKLPNPMYYIP